MARKYFISICHLLAQIMYFSSASTMLFNRCLNFLRTVYSNKVYYADFFLDNFSGDDLSCEWWTCIYLLYICIYTYIKGTSYKRNIYIMRDVVFGQMMFVVCVSEGIYTVQLLNNIFYIILTSIYCICVVCFTFYHWNIILILVLWITNSGWTVFSKSEFLCNSLVSKWV